MKSMFASIAVLLVFVGVEQTRATDYTLFDPPGSSCTTPMAIDSSGHILGWYVGDGGKQKGFLYDGSLYSELLAPGACATSGN
jgi:hypothetical protein